MGVVTLASVRTRSVSPRRGRSRFFRFASLRPTLVVLLPACRHPWCGPFTHAVLSFRFGACAAVHGRVREDVAKRGAGVGLHGDNFHRRSSCAGRRWVHRVHPYSYGVTLTALVVVVYPYPRFPAAAAAVLECGS